MPFDQLTPERDEKTIAQTAVTTINLENSILFDLRFFNKPSKKVDALYSHFIDELNDVRQSRIFKRNLRCLLFNLNRLQVKLPDGVLVCPLQHNYWSDLDRTINPYGISKKIADLAVKLSDLGYVEIKKGYFFEDGGHYTRIWPLAKFTALFKDADLADEPIAYNKSDDFVFFRIKAAKVMGKKVRPTDEPKVPATGKRAQEMSEVLRKYNNLLERADIQIPAHATGGDRIAHHNVVYRVFNNPKLTLGGRFYGGFWSYEERELRPYILINGKKTGELDYKAQHAYMAYGCFAKRHYSEVYADNDPYLLYAEDGGIYNRDSCKILLLTALNSTGELQTWRAIRYGLIQDKKAALKRYYKKEVCWAYVQFFSDQLKFFRKKNEGFDQLLDACRKKHSQIIGYFCTGKATELQYLDSQVAGYIIGKLTDEGIVVLSVHDSFIVEEQNIERLKEVMEEAYKEVNLTKALPPIERK